MFDYKGACAEWLKAADCKSVTQETLVVRIHPHPPYFMESIVIYTSTKSSVKPKFRNADQARVARENKESWDRKVAEWKAMSPSVQAHGVREQPKPFRRSTPFIPSLDSGGYVPTARQRPTYTGGNIIGIATLHKSNAVPVFSGDQAKEISSMRR